MSLILSVDFSFITKIGCSLVFKPFTEGDLKGMVLKRLDSNKDLIQDEALNLACKRVSNNNGDARSLLDVLRRAVLKSKEMLCEQELLSTSISEPVVKISHVATSFQKDINKDRASIIKNLPQDQKIVLCIATALDQVAKKTKTKSISFPQLKACSFEAMQQGLIDRLSTESFRNIVETLIDAGLLQKCEESLESLEYDSGSDDYLENDQIQVGAQLEEIDFVINKSLLDQPFYKRIVNKVKQTQT